MIRYEFFSTVVFFYHHGQLLRLIFGLFRLLRGRHELWRAKYPAAKIFSHKRLIPLASKVLKAMATTFRQAHESAMKFPSLAASAKNTTDEKDKMFVEHESTLALRPSPAIEKSDPTPSLDPDYQNQWAITVTLTLSPIVSSITAPKIISASSCAASVISVLTLR